MATDHLKGEALLHESASTVQLHAHDRIEGMSEVGRTVFAEICNGLSSKQKNKLNLHRILKGDAGSEKRRVTREAMVNAMDAAGIENGEREVLWERYFGGPPASIAEYVRQRIIRIGGMQEYADFSKLNKQTLVAILRDRTLTHETLELLLAVEVIPWEGELLEGKWRTERAEYLMRTRDVNILAARAETLFETRPHASRTEWVERNNPPAALEQYSVNKRRQMLSALRHGQITTWEEADRILFGMQCSVRERAEVAHAWLTLKAQQLQWGRTPGARGIEPEDVGSTSDVEQGDAETETSPPHAQFAEPYPEALSSLSDLESIKRLLAELEGDASLVRVTISEEDLVARLVRVLQAPARIAAPSIEQSPSAEEEEEPDFAAANATLGTQIQHIRSSVQSAWQKAMRLLEDLDIKENSKLSKRVEKGTFLSADILHEIRRITGHDVPVGRSVAKLLTMLGAIRQETLEIQRLRNQLIISNERIVGSFFKPHKFASYYADCIPLEDRKQLAQMAMIRACERFNPQLSQLSTFAYTAIRREIAKAATEQIKHRHVRSLDAEIKGKDEGASLASIVGEDDEGLAERRDGLGVAMEKISEVLDQLPETHQMLARLRFGLEGTQVLSVEQTATELNALGFRTPEAKGHGGSPYTAERVRQHEKMILRMLARHLRGEEEK